MYILSLCLGNSWHGYAQTIYPCFCISRFTETLWQLSVCNVVAESIRRLKNEKIVRRNLLKSLVSS